MARIAIDATPVDNRSGSGYYTRGLLRGLAQLPPPEGQQYVLFLPADFERQEALQLPAGSEVVRVPHPPGYRRALWLQLQLPAQLRQLRCDLFHSTFFVTSLLTACPTIVTAHDLAYMLYPQTFTRFKRWYYHTFVPRSLAKAKHLLTDSDQVRGELQQYLGIPPQKVTVIPLAVEEEFFAPPATERLETVRRKYALGEQFILCVGTVEPRKNLGIVAKAYGRLRAAGFRGELVLVGRAGWLTDEILPALTMGESAGTIRLLDFVPREDLRAIYKLATVLAFPSLHEGFGLPVLEAMASGTPVVASDIGAVQEVTGPGPDRSALLLPPSDEAQWVAGLQRVLEDQELRGTLIAAGLARAQNFTWAETARQTSAVYQRLLG